MKTQARKCSEKRQWDYFVNEIMNILHQDEAEAATTAASMLIQQLVMASRMSQAA